MTCNCNRREFHQIAASTAAFTMLANTPFLRALSSPTRGPAKACIMLFMDGAPSQFETWSPREGKSTGGPTKAVETNVPGMKFSENLPLMAARADKISVIQTMASHEGEHQRGKYLMHTGYIPDPTVEHPAVGANVAAELRDPKAELPPYVAIGNRTQGEGFLSAEYAPFVVQDPTKPPPNTTPGKNVTKEDLKDRRELLEAMEHKFASERKAFDLVKKREAIYDSAKKLMDTPLLKAFDLSQEDAKVRETYGNGRFSQGCLTARRLVQAGVKFVEVSLGGWDTHQDNFNRVATLCKDVDRGMSALIDDLVNHKMYEDTVVVWLGEFGRTPKVNGDDGRDHYPTCWSAVMGGAGIAGGILLGKTDDEGKNVVERPVSPPEFMATIFDRLGVDYNKINYSPRQRPIKLADSKAGHIKELV